MTELSVTPKKRRREKSTAKDSAMYVNNAELYAAIVERHELRKTNPDLQISPYIAECIMRICNGLSKKSQFNGSINNSYREEMVGDAIITCLRAVDKFKLDATNNPFSYLTTTAQNAFYHRIEKEKEYVNIKRKSLIHALDDNIGADGVEDEMFDLAHLSEIAENDYIGNVRNSYFEYNAARSTKGQNINIKIAKRKESNNLAQFMETSADEVSNTR